MQTAEKKRGRGRPRSAVKREGDRHLYRRIAFHLDGELEGAIETYNARQDIPPQLSTLAREALRQFFRRAGVIS